MCSLNLSYAAGSASAIPEAAAGSVLCLILSLYGLLRQETWGGVGGTLKINMQKLREGSGV